MMKRRKREEQRHEKPSWRGTDGKDKDKNRDKNIGATDGRECMILHLVLMMMMIRKQHCQHCPVVPAKFAQFPQNKQPRSNKNV